MREKREETERACSCRSAALVEEIEEKERERKRERESKRKIDKMIRL